MMRIIQPYYTWNGHYKKYTDALCKGCNFSLIYSDFFYHHPKNILTFSIARVSNSLITFIKLLFQNVKSQDVVLNIEFEPVTFIFLLFFIRRKKIRLLQTIHSVEPISTSSWIQSVLVGFQRTIFTYAVKKIKKQDDIKIIVHSQVHQRQLIKVNQDLSVIILEYPCDYRGETRCSRLISSFPIKILAFGMIRKDKGIYEFLRDLPDDFYNKIDITIAGKVYDERILAIENKKFILIDKFLTNTEIDSLMNQSHFSLLPYPESYTGGAGPLRDSASFGLPVICSKIPIFNELNIKYGFCVQYGSSVDLLSQIVNIAFTSEYDSLSKNAISFSKSNSWDSFSEKYLALTL